MRGFALARVLSNENSGFGRLNFPAKEIGKVHVVLVESSDTFTAISHFGTLGKAGINYELLTAPSSERPRKLKRLLIRAAERINRRESEGSE